ncbi:MAG: ABC transporter substrate-binding protein [Ruminococcus sp.]|nr:ABC transporter substrate-binding protein [Ruminococcus sp.]
MKNFKKSVALVAALILTASTLAACDTAEKEDGTTAATEPGATPTTAAPTGEALTVEQGKVLNIYVWNDEVEQRLEQFYLTDGEAPVVDGVAKKDDITINFLKTPNEGLAYQDKLDQVLPGNADKAADERADMFAFEADYALKYVNTDFTMDIGSLGLTDADFAGQYKYTQQIATDDNGLIKAVSWQANPCGLIYRRSIATDVLGSDDLDTVQAAVADWTKYAETAAKMGEKGYAMESAYGSSFRQFSNNAQKAIVVDGVISVPDEWKQWAEQTKTFADNGWNLKSDGMWSGASTAGYKKDGKVFCYAGPAWLFNFTMLPNAMDDPDAGAVAGNGSVGDWGIVAGPAPSYWGGTWLAAATGTDNGEIIKDIMLKLCADKEVAKKLATTNGVEDYANNIAGMQEVAASDFQSVFFGGQNQFQILAPLAEKIDVSKTLSPYGQLAETFQNTMLGYFEGTVSYDEALNNFYSEALTRYPELTQG